MAFKVFFLNSYSRSGETLVMRALSVHPKVQIVHDLYQKNSEAENDLFRLIRDENVQEIPADHALIQGREVVSDTVFVLKNATWLHKQPFRGFTLVRNAFSVCLSTGAVEDKPQRRELHHRIVRRWARGIDPLMLPFVLGATHLESVCALYTRKMMGPAPDGPIIRYEDFVHDPETKLRAILEYLGVGWDPSVLEAHTYFEEGQVGHGRIPLWEPIHTRSLDKYKTITPAQRSLIYSMTWPVFEKFGYSVSSEFDLSMEQTAPLERIGVA